MADFTQVRAIYFDLDDTLCGYWDASKAALNETFSTLLPDMAVEDSLRAWAVTFRDFCPQLRQLGLLEPYKKRGEVTRTELMRRMLKHLDRFDETLAEQLSESYMALRDRNLKLFPDALQVLDTLKPHYPLGLITNGPADIQRQEIATLGIEAYFPNIYIEGELPVGKPDPSVFLAAQTAVGCQPHEVLMVGNSYHHDIAAAHRAGWRTAWVRRPSDVPPSMEPDRAKPEERPVDGPEPDLTLGELIELLPLLKPAVV
jgi:2-haloalkanoic acid dehalogenase type II